MNLGLDRMTLSPVRCVVHQSSVTRFTPRTAGTSELVLQCSAVYSYKDTVTLLQAFLVSSNNFKYLVKF